MHANLFKILCFFCQGKSIDIVYQRICLFLWLIFAQHGLFEIQLTVYSALSRLTDLGICDITRCGIWLLTIIRRKHIGLVGWLFWGLTSIERFFSNISTWKQEITNLWKFKWRGRESNPGPLARQAKSLTTRPPLLLKAYWVLKWLLCKDLRISNLGGNR